MSVWTRCTDNLLDKIQQEKVQNNEKITYHISFSLISFEDKSFKMDKSHGIYLCILPGKFAKTTMFEYGAEYTC